MSALVLHEAMAVTISHAKTVSITLTIRRKVMSVKALAISCLLTVAAILWMVCFITGRAEGAESVNTGYINDGTRICAFEYISPDNVDTFDRYKRLIDKLEEVGIENMTAIERQIGAFLTFQVGCGTVAEDYRVVISFVKGDYALFFFDIGYGFEYTQYLMLLDSFHADEIL